MDSKKKFRLFLAFIFISLVIYILSHYLWSDFYIREIINRNYVLALLIYCVLFIILTTFSFSVSVMTGAGIIFFSILETNIVSIIGILGSSIIVFFISRKLGKKYVKNYLREKRGIKKINRIVEESSFKTILIFSAIFFMPPVVPNSLGGIIDIDLKSYIIATFLGNLPNTVFIIYLMNGIFTSNSLHIYIAIIGIVLTTLIALLFYKKEIRDIIGISFSKMRNK